MLTEKLKGGRRWRENAENFRLLPAKKRHFCRCLIICARLSSPRSPQSSATSTQVEFCHRHTRGWVNHTVPSVHMHSQLSLFTGKLLQITLYRPIFARSSGTFWSTNSPIAQSPRAPPPKKKVRRSEKALRDQSQNVKKSWVTLSKYPSNTLQV